MTTPAEPQTRTGAVADRSRRLAAAASARKRRRIVASGQPLMVPAGPATAHIGTLLETMTRAQIGLAGGLPQTTVTAIAAGQKTRIHADIADAILATKLKTDIGAGRPALATTRRLRGLACDAWSMREVARETGVSVVSLQRYLRGAFTRVRCHVEDAVAEFCAAHAGENGASPTAARRARAKGWNPLSAWTPETIGDPRAEPPAAREAAS